MNIKSVREFLYKTDDEFALLYDSLIEVNRDFKLLLDKKKESSKKLLCDKTLSQLTQSERNAGIVLIDKIVDIIFKDIGECHKKIYS